MADDAVVLASVPPDTAFEEPSTLVRSGGSLVDRSCGQWHRDCFVAAPHAWSSHMLACAVAGTASADAKAAAAVQGLSLLLVRRAVVICRVEYCPVRVLSTFDLVVAGRCFSIFLGLNVLRLNLYVAVMPLNFERNVRASVVHYSPSSARLFC